MRKFYKDYLGFQELSEDKTLVRLSGCLELIEESEFEEDLIELFDFEGIENETIAIAGLRTVIKSIISRDREFKKIDLKSHISNVTCIQTIDGNTVRLRFNDASDIGMTFVDAQTVYSAKREYFEGFYKMDKFANFCISEGHFGLLQENIEYLNKKYEDSDSHIKNFRLLQDKEGEYYVRAITSTSQYYDYNIRFSLFVTIVALYHTIKNTGYHFEISRCEYSESFIRVYFQKDNASNIPNIGKLSFVLEMSNDEIKREAFKFSGLFTLQTEDGKNQMNIFLKPKRIETKLISIRHNFLPSTVIEQLEGLSRFIEEAEKEMKRDIIELNNVKNPDHLRFFLLRKIESSQNKELSQFKPKIKETLDVKIHKINELLILMGKIDEIVTDLEVKEYLRYLFYEILRDKKERN
ncbi:MAG: hypothetical protein MI974_31800 [Chitinophagales bacterium]|nr:hypothetical protein [Chitinophagales bacterium]